MTAKGRKRAMRLVSVQRGWLLPRDHALFENCHASTIVALPGGGLLAAFFAGRREGEGDTAIWLSRWPDGGWGAPVRAFAEEGLAHWNPVLHAQGRRVWLFYKVGPTVHDWTTRVAVSEDAGRTWSPAAPLVSGDSAPRGPVKNKLIVLSNGDWLAPASVETELYWDAFVDRSGDHGRTWQRADIPFQHRPAEGHGAAGIWTGLAANALWETSLDRVFRWDGVIQPTLWESAPGQVHMLLRSTRGRVFRSDSADGGLTWCAAYATDLPNNNSGLDLDRLGDGTLVLAFNPVEGNWGRRYPISLAASADNGATWTPLQDLETEEGEFSYPAVLAAGSELHVTYTWNRKNSVHHRFTVT
jgi:predicted neuraminidase